MADVSSDNPQCYNCGQHGHWAVACPEPTRQTPAGLLAWRNASSAPQGHGKDSREGGINNSGKKTKGPIITRYGPPPSQTPPPQPYHSSQPGYSQRPSQYQQTYPPHNHPPQNHPAQAYPPQHRAPQNHTQQNHPTHGHHPQTHHQQHHLPQHLPSQHHPPQHHRPPNHPPQSHSYPTYPPPAPVGFPPNPYPPSSFHSHQPPASSFPRPYSPYQNHSITPPPGYPPPGYPPPPAHDASLYSSYQPHHPLPHSQSQYPVPTPPSHGPSPPPPHRSFQRQSLPPPSTPYATPPHQHQSSSQRRYGDNEHQRSRSRQRHEKPSHTANGRKKNQTPHASTQAVSRSEKPKPFHSTNPVTSQLPLPAAGAGVLSLPPKPPPTHSTVGGNAPADRGQLKKPKPDRKSNHKDNKPRNGQPDQKDYSNLKRQDNPKPVKQVKQERQQGDGVKQSTNNKRRDRKKKRRLAKQKQEHDLAKQETIKIETEKQGDLPRDNSEAPLSEAPLSPVGPGDGHQLGEASEMEEEEEEEKADQQDEALLPATAVSEHDLTEISLEDQEQDWEWEKEAIFRKEEEPPYGPDETGRPIPLIYDDGIILPRKWDATCIESDFVRIDNLEQFLKPIRETSFWEALQFDPAFIIDGAFSDGTTLEAAKALTRVLPETREEVIEAAEMSPVQSTTHTLSDHSGEDPSSQKNPKSSQRSRPTEPSPRQSPSNIRHHGSTGKRARDDSSDKHSSQRGDRLDPQKSRERGVSYQRRRSTSPPRHKRETSVSSDQSSDLSSIEAELLGRVSKKAKKEKTDDHPHPGDGSERQDLHGSVRKRSRSRDRERARNRRER